MKYIKLTKTQRRIQRLNIWMDDHAVEIGVASYLGLWVCALLVSR